MRFFGYLILFALIAFGIWPYYYVFKLDDALGQSDTQALAPLVDLPAIRANYKERVSDGTDALLPDGGPDSVVGFLRQNLQRLGDAALDQVITLDWVRETLRSTTTKATEQSPPYLLAGIDFAFFESYNRFLIRIGDLGHNPTHVRMSLEGYEWKITDIIQ